MVSLVALPNMEGGEFTTLDREIKIGLQGEWAEVCAWMVHELFEMSCCQRELRYIHSGKRSYDTADFMFMFDHPQFARVTTDVGAFLSEALPELAKVYHKHKRV